ncbi:SAM-dependent methyltransferase [Actinomadura barringtoniae]|nr:SAM-dependent methyltransferase [Actinomadura barringtoniae]
MTISGPAGREGQADMGVPHSARIWNFWLGGRDNYPVDRKAGNHILGWVPELVISAKADRRFLARAVTHLAKAGVRQYLDIGTGLPTVDNTHEVAQRIAPDSRIVYVDNDPLVLVHAQALLTSSAEGSTAYIESDVNDPARIIEKASASLDFSRPVAVMMLGILNFVMDDDDARAIVGHLVDAVPSGSYLAISHPTGEVGPEPMTRAVRYWNDQGAAPMRLRTREELESFFTGLELIDPGVVSCVHWNPEPGDDPIDVPHFCGVARKP